MGKRATLYWWNGKLQSIREIAKHLNVTYLTAQHYLDRGFCSDNELVAWRDEKANQRYRLTVKKQNRSELPSPEYDNFIADMKSWGKPNEP